jgi:hypothetical protein
MNETIMNEARDRKIRNNGPNDFNVFFPLPWFLGDGKEWNVDLFDAWLLCYIWDATRDPYRALRVGFNRLPKVALAGSATLVDGINHVSVKTVKDEPFVLMFSDRSLILHADTKGRLPLDERVSVHSEKDADDLVALNNKIFAPKLWCGRRCTEESGEFAKFDELPVVK